MIHRKFWKVLFLLVMVAAFVLGGCGPASSSEQASDQQSQQDSPAEVVPAIPPQVKPTEDPAVKIAGRADKASVIWEERLYVVTLKFMKEEFTIDPFALMGNELAAQYYDIVVGPETYEGWSKGDEVSRKFDGVNFFFGDDISSYVVSVSEKDILHQYYLRQRNDKVVELSEEEYKGMLQYLEKNHDTVTIPYSFATFTYVLDKPLNQYEFTGYEPLYRYYVTIHVQNHSLTLDLVKHMRNATTDHEIEVEVTENMYNTETEAWKSQMAVGSFVVKGHLSNITGEIIDRRKVEDPNFVRAFTSAGREMIIPKR